MTNKKIIYSLSALLAVALLIITQFDTETIPDFGKKYLKDYSYLAKKAKQLDRPDLAIQQENEMTLDPALGYPPVQRLVRAFKETKAMRLNGSRTLKQDDYTWTERGPNNVGGRTRALIFDPTDSTNRRVFAGGIGGGLWYTEDITDANESWKNVNDFLPNLAISSLYADPRNDKIWYASTGLGYTGTIRGAGIFKTTDAGKTWTQLQSTANKDFRFVQKVLVNRQGTLFASTSKGIYVSSDSAKTWKLTLSGLGADIEFASDSVIFASLGYGLSLGSVHVSKDAGNTWKELISEGEEGARRIELAVAPSNPNVVYAVADKGGGSKDIAWFKKSTNQGADWTDVTIPLYQSQDCKTTNNHYTRGQAFFDLILAVHPDNPDKVIAGGIDLHKSSNGGKTWNGVSYWTGVCDTYVHADQHAIVFRPNHPDEAIFGNDGGVYYSKDIGNAQNPNFVQRVKGYNVTTFYATTSKNEINSDYFLAGAQDNGTVAFSKPGINDTKEVTGGDGAYCFIDEDNPDVQISSYVYNNYYLTTDNWKTGKVIANDSKSGMFINPTDYDSKANVLYSAGKVDEYKIITNIGSSPSKQEIVSVDFDGRQITTIKVSPHTSNRIFVGVRLRGDTREARLYQIDRANTFSPIVTEITGQYDGRHGQWVANIDVGESDNHLLATFSNYGVNSVYETKDGGITWENKEGNLPDMPIRWGVFDPSDREKVYLATELGVWITEDITTFSPVWKEMNKGLANVRTTMLKIRPIDNVMYAATFGRGLYTTDAISNKSSAKFKATTIAYVGAAVDFYDASLNPNGSWLWDFGDGTTSALQNPKHKYNRVGKYTVSLKVANGSGRITKENYITVLPRLTPPFTLSDGGDFETNEDYFLPKSVYGDTQIWERGIPGNEMNKAPSGKNVWKTKLNANVGNKDKKFATALYTPAFDLSKAGDYKLKFKLQMKSKFCNVPYGLQVHYTTDKGKNWAVLGSSYKEYGAVNWYNRGNNLGCAIHKRIFQNKTGWLINLDEPMEVEYSLNRFVGDSAIAFRIYYAQSSGFKEESYEKDGVLIDDFEIQYNKTSARFTSDLQVSYINTPVTFQYRSTGATSYEWDFGDGKKSTEANPKHTYNKAGNYTVSLKIKSPTGEAVKIKKDYITIMPYFENPNLSLEDGGNMESNSLNFTALNIKGSGFSRGKSSVTGKNGTNSGENAWVIGINNQKYDSLSEAYLYTPSFNFLGLGYYEFKFFANFSFESQWDGFIVEYTTNKGKSWRKLNPESQAGWYNTISDDESIFGSKVPFFSGKTDGFKAFSANVNHLAGNKEVAFRFKFLSDPATNEAGLAIDDVTVSGPVPGPAVIGFRTENMSGCESDTAIFYSNSKGSIAKMEWNFGSSAIPNKASGAGPHKVVYTNTGKVKVSFKIEDFDKKEQVKEQEYTIALPHNPSFSYVKNSDGTYTLTASQGDSYQWLSNGKPIEGATGKTYKLGGSIKGLISVRVNIAGCSAETEAEVITGVGNEEDTILLYPNPTTGLVYIRGIIPITNYKVFDISGKLVDSGLVENSKVLDLQLLPKGIYLVLLQDQFGNIYRNKISVKN